MILSGIFSYFFRNELMKELSEAMSDSSAVKKEISRITSDNGKIKKTLKEQEAKIPLWRKKIESLTLHEIPNETMPDSMLDDTQYQITQMKENLALNKPNPGAINETTRSARCTWSRSRSWRTSQSSKTRCGKLSTTSR
jgi:seryl-tRNA synthetase